MGDLDEWGNPVLMAAPKVERTRCWVRGCCREQAPGLAICAPHALEFNASTWATRRRNGAGAERAALAGWARSLHP